MPSPFFAAIAFLWQGRIHCNFKKIMLPFVAMVFLWHRLICRNFNKIMLPFVFLLQGLFSCNVIIVVRYFFADYVNKGGVPRPFKDEIFVEIVTKLILQSRTKSTKEYLIISLRDIMLALNKEKWLNQKDQAKPHIISCSNSKQDKEDGSYAFFLQLVNDPDT